MLARPTMMAVRLQERTFASSVRPRVLACSSERPSYKVWDEQQVIRAYKAIQENKCLSGRRLYMYVTTFLSLPLVTECREQWLLVPIVDLSIAWCLSLDEPTYMYI